MDYTSDFCIMDYLSASDIGFTLGLIFLSFIFYPILGYGDSKYIGPAGAN